MLAKLTSAIADPKQLKNVAFLRVGRLVGARDYRKFIVLSRSRAGSNLLNSLLNSQRHVIARGEIFSRVAGKTYDEVLSDVFCRYPKSIKAVGFKIFYYHPLDDETGEIWHRLKSIEDLTVVHLKRRNILKTLVSRKIAMKTDSWARGEKDRALPLDLRRVSFTAKELLDGFQRTSDWHEKFDDLFDENPTAQIYYEDLIAEPEQNMRELCDVLGIEGGGFATKMKKQNEESLSSLVLNYGEMKEYFAGTKWFEFFE